MKKIFVAITLIFIISSCGVNTNTQNKNNVNNVNQETMNNKKEVVNLSSDEEKLIESLLK